MKNLFRLFILGMVLNFAAQALYSQELQSNATKKQVVTHLYNKMFVTRTAPVILEKFKHVMQHRGYIIGKVIIMNSSSDAKSEVGYASIYKELTQLTKELVYFSDVKEIEAIIYKFVNLALNECGSLDVLIGKIQELDAKQTALVPLVDLLYDKLFENTTWTVPYKLLPGTKLEHRGYTVGKVMMAVRKSDNDTPFMCCIAVDNLAQQRKIIVGSISRTTQEDPKYYISIFLNLALNECTNVEDLKKKILDQENKVIERTINVESEETTLYISDYDKIDNDIVDYYLNGNLVEQDVVLSRKPYEISINSKENPKTEIMLLAKSTGRVGPCTIKVKVKEIDKTFTLGAKKGQLMKITLQKITLQ